MLGVCMLKFLRKSDKKDFKEEKIKKVEICIKFAYNILFTLYLIIHVGALAKIHISPIWWDHYNFHTKMSLMVALYILLEISNFISKSFVCTETYLDLRQQNRHNHDNHNHYI